VGLLGLDHAETQETQSPDSFKRWVIRINKKYLDDAGVPHAVEIVVTIHDARGQSARVNRVRQALRALKL
jgi:hypothetical protein